MAGRSRTQPASELNVDKLIRLMVGRDLSESSPRKRPRGAEILRVEGLSQGTRLQDISFTAYAGEVLGIAGLVGAGRTELVRADLRRRPDRRRHSLSSTGKPVDDRARRRTPSAMASAC